jgi:hypothetical protein
MKIKVDTPEVKLTNVKVNDSIRKNIQANLEFENKKKVESKAKKNKPKKKVRSFAATQSIGSLYPELAKLKK